ESRAQPGIEQETIFLQAANVLLKLKQIDRARVLLARVNAPVLLKQKKTLLDQLPSKAEK
ncbi:MAG: hypothetical protein B9S28_06210, partial [Opitutia bacterium Tous-C10FEB]